MKKIVLLSVLLLIALGTSVYTEEIGGLSTVLSPVKFGGKKLPSWLTSDYAPIFNGVNQYAQATLANPIFTNWTLMAWAKPYAGYSNVITSRTGPNGGVLVQLTPGGASYVYSQASSKLWAHTTPTSVKNAEWNHVTVTHADRILSYYINGSVSTYTSTTNATWVVDTTTYFGTNQGTIGNSNTSIAELSIWNRALSQDEILRYKDKRLKGTESGLVAYYPMSDNSQTLIDKVGGKNAIASNTITWTSRNGYAAPDVRSERYCLSFDGVDDYGVATYSGQISGPNDAFSVSGWFFFPTYSNNIRPWFAIGSDTVINYFGIGSSISNELILISYSSTVLASPTLKFDNAWHHIVVTCATSPRTLGSCKLYLDGSLRSITADGSPFSIGTGVIRLYSRLATTPVVSKGKCAEITVWKKELSPSEAVGLMYSPPANLSDPNLIYYFKGNEGTGTTMTNLGSAGAAGNLTLYNSPTWVGRDIP